MAIVEDDELYCLCRRPYDETEFMIECDVCNDWFHGSCVGIEEHQAPDIDSYHCPNCQPEHGPLTLKRRRNSYKHDYSEINDGNKAVQSGTVMFVDKLKKKRFLSAETELLAHLKGSEVTVQYFEDNGFSQPIMVEENDGLRLKVPPTSFTISDVEKCVGSMRELDVIDVSRQDDFRMNMREWTEYYEVNKPRRKILNVISLEFTGTELAKLVTPPLIVRKIDWINCHWPDDIPEGCLLSRPSVQKYCLMSVKDSYTDFHVDFGGTSVWYHILWGEKVFYLIPPTEENLLQYEQWGLSSDQSEVFFGDLVPKCYICNVRQGNTLFIPSGWIHAVLTPKDSLVFGGNFLHRYAIPMQLRIYEMEFRLNTPLKFRHPCYEALNWFTAKDLVTELKEHGTNETTPPSYLIVGLKELAYSLNYWTRAKEKMKIHAMQIPPNITPTLLLERISRSVRNHEEDHNQHSLDSPDGRSRSSRRIQRSQKWLHSGWDDDDLTATNTPGGAGHSTRRKSDKGKGLISVKLSVPQSKVVSSSVNQGWDDNENVKNIRSHGNDSRGTERLFKDELSSSEESLQMNPDPASRHKRPKSENAIRKERKKEIRKWSEEEYEDDDYVYPSLVSDEEQESHDHDINKKVESSGMSRSKDDVWKPQSEVNLSKDAAYNSREKRNTTKRSFEHTLAATASKILKIEEQKKTSSDQKQGSLDLSAPKHLQINPVLGGGSLKGELLAANRSRAAAAADAVNAVVAASKPKTKLLTAKQRLGKIMGLKGGNSRWKV